MGTLIALEGLDGAGKRTLSNALVAAWRAGGLTVATLAFPRYGVSACADLGAEALHGGHGDTAESVNAMALLWALDRRDAADELRELVATHDIVLLDRYVASNAAYTAARKHQSAQGPEVEWIEDLEFGRFGLPRPDLQILLKVPVALAADRARRRAGTEADRQRDAYERDGDLQTRTGEVYDGLTSRAWISPWTVVGPDVDPAQLAADVTNQRRRPSEVTR